MSGLPHGLNASPHGDALLKPGKDYELHGNEIVPAGNTARIDELEGALRELVDVFDPDTDRVLGTREALNRALAALADTADALPMTSDGQLYQHAIVFGTREEAEAAQEKLKATADVPPKDRNLKQHQLGSCWCGARHEEAPPSDAAPPRERVKCEGCGVWHFPGDPCPEHAGDLLAAPPFVDAEALRFASMCYADGPDMSAEGITRNIVEAYLRCVPPPSDAGKLNIVDMGYDEQVRRGMIVSQAPPSDAIREVHHLIVSTMLPFFVEGKMRGWRVDDDEVADLAERITNNVTSRPLSEAEKVKGLLGRCSCQEEAENLLAHGRTLEGACSCADHPSAEWCDCPFCVLFRQYVPPPSDAAPVEWWHWVDDNGDDRFVRGDKFPNFDATALYAHPEDAPEPSAPRCPQCNDTGVRVLPVPGFPDECPCGGHPEDAPGGPVDTGRLAREMAGDPDAPVGNLMIDTMEAWILRALDRLKGEGEKDG